MDKRFYIVQWNKEPQGKAPWGFLLLDGVNRYVIPKKIYLIRFVFIRDFPYICTKRYTMFDTLKKRITKKIKRKFFGNNKNEVCAKRNLKLSFTRDGELLEDTFVSLDMSNYPNDKCIFTLYAEGELVFSGSYMDLINKLREEK